MTGSLCAAGIVTCLDLGVGARYCVRLLRGETHPRLATWLIFELGVVMSLVAYFTSHDHRLVKAALNVTDAAVVTVIIVAMLMGSRRKRVRFTRNEYLCLVIAGMTMTAWAITRAAWIGFFGFQVVMTVAYVPTIDNMWRWRPGQSPEPVETWSVNALAALIGVVIDVTGSHDYVAMLYPLRAFLLCMLIVALVLRWKRKTRMETVWRMRSGDCSSDIEQV